MSALREALEHVDGWLASAPHGDNCFLTDDPPEFNICRCGKDDARRVIEEALLAAASQEITEGERRECGLPLALPARTNEEVLQETGVTAGETATQQHERIRANMLAAEAWPDGTTHDEKRLRGLLARRVGLTYGDDGELQSSEPRPAIDFKRDSVDEIERKLYERAIAAMTKQGPAQSHSEDK